MHPRTSIFMPSYNKGAYILDGIRSIQAQTDPLWELWIMDNSTDDVTRPLIREVIRGDERIIYDELTIDDETRARVHPMPYLLNKYYGQAEGEYILYISDDDLLEPEVLQRATGYLDANPELGACYFHLRLAVVTEPGQVGPFDDRGIRADWVRGPGMCDCQVDGGQLIHRKSCLDAMPQPWFPEDRGRERHCDGVFLESLASVSPLYPLDYWGAVHRYTSVSTWHIPAEQGL